MYQAPELQYIGEAAEVILGVNYAGGDFMGQSDYPEQEFERD